MPDRMFVLLIAFKKEHQRILVQCNEIMEWSNDQMAIHPKLTKLITALRTAVENGESTLDKDTTSHDDLFDSFRLSLMVWH